MEQTTTRVSVTSAGLPGRYAAALFDLAEQQGLLDRTAADLETVDRVLLESADFRLLTADRSINRKAAGGTVAALSKSLGLGDLASHFLGVLAANRRLAALPAILAQFRRLRNARNGTTTASVASAQPLSAAQKRALESKLAARTGQKVEIESHIDPSLLGGLVVRIGSEQIDSSIKTRLLRLGQQMKG